MPRSLFAVMLIAISATSQAAAPSISIGSLYDQLPSDTSRMLKRVRNTGDATAYVRVEVSRIVFDAQGHSHEEPVDTVALSRNDGAAQGIVASPSRLIIPANGGQQATTLVHRGARDEERYYRLRFVPVVPDTAEFALNDDQKRDYARAVSTSISVFTGYGSVLMVPPRESRFATRVDGNVVHNDGNATVVLENLRYCTGKAERDCGTGIKVHVRPGQTHTIESRDAQTARFQLIEGRQRRDIALSG